MFRATLVAGLLTVGSSLPAARASYVSDVSNTPGLVGYWRLGEAAGPTAQEEKNNLDGTYINVAAGDFSKPGAVTGDPDTAVRFNGTTSYVDAGNPALLNGNWDGVTVAAWINPDNVNTDFRLIAGKWAGAVNQDHFALFQGGTKLLFAVGSGTGAGENGLQGNGNVPLVAGQYNFVVGTWDKTTKDYRMYVNGQADTATGDQSGTGINTGSTTSFKIGAQVAGAPRYFPGIIDETAVFNRALTGDEIASLYAAATVPEPGAASLLALAGVGLLARRRA